MSVLSAGGSIPAAAGQRRAGLGPGGLWPGTSSANSCWSETRAVINAGGRRSCSNRRNDRRVHSPWSPAQPPAPAWPAGALMNPLFALACARCLCRLMYDATGVRYGAAVQAKHAQPAFLRRSGQEASVNQPHRTSQQTNGRSNTRQASGSRCGNGALKEKPLANTRLEVARQAKPDRFRAIALCGLLPLAAPPCRSPGAGAGSSVEWLGSVEGPRFRPQRFAAHRRPANGPLGPSSLRWPGLRDGTPS